MEDDGMVRDDQIAAFALGFVKHFVRHVHGQQGRVHFVVRAADDQTRIVVGSLPRERREALDDIGYILDFHRMLFSCRFRPAAPVPLFGSEKRLFIKGEEFLVLVVAGFAARTSR